MLKLPTLILPYSVYKYSVQFQISPNSSIFLDLAILESTSRIFCFFFPPFVKRIHFFDNFGKKFETKEKLFSTNFLLRCLKHNSKWKENRKKNNVEHSGQKIEKRASRFILAVTMTDTSEEPDTTLSQNSRNVFLFSKKATEKNCEC